MSADTETTVTNNRSLALRVKGVVGHGTWRLLTRPVAACLSRVPPRVLYAVGARLRRDTYPYRTIREGDTVVQVGAPLDLLRLGRSRAVYFAMMVGDAGRVIVFEPETRSAEAIRDYLEKSGLAHRVSVVAKGCWSSEGDLKFYSNPDHPASSMLADVADTDVMARGGYEEVVVPVVTIDGTLNQTGAPAPRLVSITTNGAEEEIMQGARETLGHEGLFLALADTGPGLREAVEKLGFRLVAKDDRGFTFSR